VLRGKHNDVIPYEVWGLTLTEVEVDILTGEYKVQQVELDFVSNSKMFSGSIDCLFV